MIAREEAENDEIGYHEEEKEELEVTQSGKPILDFELVERAAVEINEGVEEEDRKDRSFDCKFKIVRLMIEDDEQHVEVAQQENQPLPEYRRLYIIQYVICRC
jgi:hypothetical protein